jgi:hypothetical protein
VDRCFSRAAERLAELITRHQQALATQRAVAVKLSLLRIGCMHSPLYFPRVTLTGGERFELSPDAVIAWCEEAS